MSKQQFPPLYAQVADKLGNALKAGASFYQKPVKENGTAAFIKPVNPVTGKGYSALNAINLALKGFEDPRFLSAKDANYAGYMIKEGAKATLINFPKKSDIQAVRTPEGEKIKGEDGKTITKTVEFEKAEQGKAFLFNGTQIKDFPPLEEFLKEQEPNQPLSPIERAEKLIEDSKATIVHGGQEAYYDKSKDIIHLPKKESFGSVLKYLQAALHQLAHWTGHESRLNRPMEGKFGSLEYGREELRAATAAMLIGAELKIGHNFGQHAAYSSGWAKTLKDEPYEMARVANDAQRITGSLLKVGQKQEQKQDTAVSKTLSKGEEIAYNNTTYKVLDVKGKTAEIEKADTGEKFKATPNYGIYQKLVEARNNLMQNERAVEKAPEPDLVIEGEQTRKIGR